VKRERLEFLADNPFYTKRFAHYVGRRCRTATIKDLAVKNKGNKGDATLIYHSPSSVVPVANTVTLARSTFPASG